MRTGAQLYTVRAYTQNEKDFAFTIKKLQIWAIKQSRYPLSAGI